MDTQNLPSFALQRLHKLKSKAAHAASDATILREEYNAAMYHIGELQQSLNRTVNIASNDKKRALLQESIAEAKANAEDYRSALHKAHARQQIAESELTTVNLFLKALPNNVTLIDAREALAGPDFATISSDLQKLKEELGQVLQAPRSEAELRQIAADYVATVQRPVVAFNEAQGSIPITNTTSAAFIAAILPEHFTEFILDSLKKTQLGRRGEALTLAERQSRIAELRSEIERLEILQEAVRGEDDAGSDNLRAEVLLGLRIQNQGPSASAQIAA